MTPLDYALFAATGLFTALLTAMIGFGGGTIMIGVILLFLPPAAAIPFHGLVQVVANGWRVWLFRRHVAWHLCLRFAALLPLGVAVGLWLFQGLGAAAIQLLIGCFVLFSLFTRQLKVFRQRDLPLAAFWPLGFVMGILNMTVGAAATLLGVLVVRKELNKEAIIGTLAFLAGSGHVAKVVAFGLVGFDFSAHLAAFAVMVPAVMLGTVIGKWFLGRIDEHFFMIVFQLMLVLLSIKLIVWEGLLKLI